MQRCFGTVALLVTAVMIGGCSIAGTWKTVKTDPTDAGGRSPFEMVTFNDDGGFTATGQHGDRVINSTGTYEWAWGKLIVRPSEGEERSYPCQLNIFTKQLKLSHTMGEEKMTAWMEQQAEGG